MPTVSEFIAGLLLLLSSFKLCVGNICVVKPTLVDIALNREYYIASDVYGSLAGVNIKCNPLRNCYIQCSLINGCLQTYVECSSPSCIITCDASNSCEQMEINAIASPQVDISCSEADACRDSIMSIQADNSVASQASIYCFTTGACHGIRFYSNTNTDIDCAASTQSCGTAKFYIDSGADNDISTTFACKRSINACVNVQVHVAGSGTGTSLAISCAASWGASGANCHTVSAYCGISTYNCVVTGGNSRYALYVSKLYCKGGEATTCTSYAISGTYSFSYRAWTPYPTTAAPTGPAPVTLDPTYCPTVDPTIDPTRDPTTDPTDNPTTDPTIDPTRDPTTDPTDDPTVDPTIDPTYDPTFVPTFQPTNVPTFDPTDDPTVDPTTDPTYDPTFVPTFQPTNVPTFDPTVDPTRDPTSDPTVDPTVDPTIDPTYDPTVDPTVDPTTDPTTDPTADPTTDPTVDPTSDPTADPTADPTVDPTYDPTVDPTYDPTIDPTQDPTYDPTTDPTVDPTLAPSISPSIAPSLNPSLTPTLAPSLTPSLAPTLAPSVAPSLAPTLAPSLAPTLTPTLAPSLAPTLAPSLAPTTPPSNQPSLAPTLAPSIAPTTPPSLAPTLAPSLAPSIAPSLTPSIAPTQAPSLNPTLSPSLVPSVAPSLTPTQPPTLAPTRYPTTSDEYASSFMITYLIKNLENEYAQILVDDIVNIWDEMIEIIEQSYLETTGLKYRFFQVQIQDILGYERNDITTDQYQIFADAQNDGITINSVVKCRQHSCEILSNYFRFQEKFEAFGTNKFREYFVAYLLSNANVNAEDESGSQLIFEIASYGKLEALYPEEEVTLASRISDNILLVVLFCILVVTFIISFLAFIHSKVTQTDCIWYALMLWGVQFVVLVSDLNVCFEILFYEDFMTDLRITICGVFCIFFILIPYYLNIYFGGKITTMISKQTDNNNVILFFQDRNVFMVLILLCGGFYPVLFLLSSNIFGMDSFNSGLLNYDLKEMNYIKIIATTCVQDIPQILVQCIFASSVGIISPTIAFAFVMSILSIICMPFYKINCKTINTHFTYSLEIKIINDIHTDQMQYLEFEDDISNKFISNKGKTNQMSTILCDAFECPQENIEISRNPSVGTLAITLYVMHFVNNNSNMNIQDIIKVYLEKQSVLKNEFKNLFNFTGGECMIITFLHGKYEIELEINKNNETNVDDFDLLNKLMNERRLNYNLISDKQTFLTTVGEPNTNSTIASKSTSDVELELILTHPQIIDEIFHEIPEQEINANISFDHHNLQINDDSQSESSDISFHV